MENNYFSVDAAGVQNTQLLRSAAIYGANASGKSNIVKAIREMNWFVLNSAKALGPEELIDAEPFLFDSVSKNEPSEFYVDFVSRNVRYQYGFTLTKERVLEEWLFAYPNGRAQTWFERTYDHESGTYVYSRDTNLAGKKSVWKETTRDNALFLSTAIMLNSKQLKPVYDWFDTTLKGVGFNGIDPTYTASVIVEHDMKDEVLEFLKKADLGIEDLEAETKDFDYSSLPAEIPDDIKKIMMEKLGDVKHIDIKTGHKDDAGNIEYIDLSSESDGTQRIFALAAPIMDVLKNGYVLVIDELHNSLHPNLVKHLVSLFNNPEKNKKNAQLIFTTHETSILSQDIFRRDQIWFCEKNEDSSTHLYSLSEFKVRKGVENIERNYLSGKYGALPFVSMY